VASHECAAAFGLLYHVPTSRHQMPPHLPTRSALQRQNLELLTFQLSPLGAPTPADAFRTLAAEAGTTIAMSGNRSINFFCQGRRLHDTSWDLLHVANLRHETHGFTSLPKACLRIFTALKNPKASAGFEPANLGTRGQHADHRSRWGEV
jgi:hypothetical protein